MYFPNFEATDSEQRSGGLPGYSDITWGLELVVLVLWASLTHNQLYQQEEYPISGHIFLAALSSI